MLYSDPSGAVENLLSPSTQGKAWEQVSDEYATLHTAWKVDDPQLITAVTAAMRDKRLVIADGHHRYETALAYRNYCREHGIKGTASDYVMMTFVRMETDGLTVLPTHRMVHSLANFDWAKFSASAKPMFDVESVHLAGAPSEATPKLIEKLVAAGRG